MKILAVAFLTLAVFACDKTATSSPPQKTTAAASGFCGHSTQGACNSDADCVSGGCSGQICQSKKEDGMISTCEYRECYDAKKFNLACACVQKTCQWR